jgi:hypothetical protein
VKESKAASEDSEDFYDPNHLWQGLGLNHPLPYETVLEGFTRYLVHAIRWSWDHATSVTVNQPWYLARDEGLKAWCRQAAKSRMAINQRPTYTLVQFHRLVFTERMRRGGAKAMSDPVWTPLFEHMQLSGNVQFFARLPYLFNQRPPVANMGQWLFCLLWDRARIPLEYWSSPAAQGYLLTRLGPNVAPSEDGLRLWVSRLGLVRGHPAVVTNFDPASGIPPEGFNAEALKYHGIPYQPPGVDTQNYNIS